MADFQLALCHIVPSMYRGLEGMVEFNSVSWEDIGGLQDVKQALKQVQLCFVMFNYFYRVLVVSCVNWKWSAIHISKKKDRVEDRGRHLKEDVVWIYH